MLSHLRLKNFQVHKNLEIKLDPHVTTIMGPSDKGKSAIIRALYWLCFNRPVGNSFIRHNAPFCRVSAKVDGRHLTRTKGKGNTYEINGQKYKAFHSSGVPSDVEELLQVSETNFQRQLDQPFWFTDSPGQVSKSLNKIVHLDKIDSTLRRINAEERTTKTKIEIIQERIQDARDKRKNLKWIKRFSQELNALEQIRVDLLLVCEKSRLLRSTIKDASQIKKDSVLASNAIFRGDKLLRIATQFDELKSRQNSLISLIGDMRESEQAIKPVPSLKEVKGLQEFRDKANFVAEKTRRLRHIVEDLLHARREKCKLEKNLNIMEKKMLKWKRCPTCGQTLSQSYVQTFTSAKQLRRLAQRRLIGSRLKQGS